MVFFLKKNLIGHQRLLKQWLITLKIDKENESSIFFPVL